MGVFFGVINKAGMWYSYKGDKWQGKEKSLEAIRADKSLQDELSFDVLLAATRPELVDQLVTTDED